MVRGVRGEIVVDLDAIRDNVAVLREHVDRPLMAVVKADAYGHGLVPAARAALSGGADMLGVAVVEEAFALRSAGITAPVLAWLAVPGERLADALTCDVDLSVSAVWGLEEVVAAAVETGRRARVHLEVDTGLSRGGAAPVEWPALVDAAIKARDGGEVEVVAIWSHLAHADTPGHPTTVRQIALLHEAAELARDRGLGRVALHLANSPATLAEPDTWLDLVRPGVACYGLDPTAGHPAAARAASRLRPAMTVSAQVAMVRRIAAGDGVSYGHTYTAPADTTVVTVPVGYGDGVPRAAGNRAEVLVAGARRRISGRVCMDQFVVDVGPGTDVQPGDPVILWGPGDLGEPTAQEWASALDTIHYELVTRIGGRFVRRYVGTDAQ